MKNYNKQISKKYYKNRPSLKAFSSYSVQNFDDKEVNVWENNKIDIINVKDTYNKIDLVNKIKNANNRNLKIFQKSCTFNEIIKCANIYDTNLE